MQEFKKLHDLLDQLLGPNGCPWDKAQTMSSLRGDLLEECYEVLEAVDLDDNKDIAEELGDLLFGTLLFCKIGEKEGRFTTAKILQEAIDKLIRRHPHVFEKREDLSNDQVLEKWEEIKRREKSYRKSAIDGIPKAMPALAKAQEIVKKVGKTEQKDLIPEPEGNFSNEEELGKLLLKIVKKAKDLGIDAEQALLKELVLIEKAFRDREKM